MKDYLINALAGTTVRVQNWRLCIGVKSPLDRLGAPYNAPKGPQPVEGPARAFPLHALSQRVILLKEIDIDQRRNLVEDLMSRMTGSGRRPL